MSNLSISCCSEQQLIVPDRARHRLQARNVSSTLFCAAPSASKQPMCGKFWHASRDFEADVTVVQRPVTVYVLEQAVLQPSSPLTHSSRSSRAHEGSRVDICPHRLWCTYHVETQIAHVAVDVFARSRRSRRTWSSKVLQRPGQRSSWRVSYTNRDLRGPEVVPKLVCTTPTARGVPGLRARL
jgi:hypothetical protein